MPLGESIGNDLPALARRLELSAPEYAPGALTATLQELTVFIRHVRPHLELRLAAPSELPGVFDANPGGSTSFDQLVVGDEAFDRLVRVRCSDPRRVSMVMALSGGATVRAQLIRLISTHPEATVNPQGLRLSVPDDDEGVATLARAVREGAEVVRALASLAVRDEVLARPAISRLAERLTLDDVSEADAAISGRWEGLRVTLEQDGDVVRARVQAPSVLDASFIAAPTTTSGTNELARPQLGTGDERFDGRVLVRCAEPGRERIVGVLRSKARLRGELTDLFSRYPAAVIEHDALIISAPASEVDQLYQALRAGAPLLVALAQLDPYRSPLPSKYDVSRAGLLIFWLGLLVLGVAGLVDGCHPPS